jgi:hypothetical protein
MNCAALHAAVAIHAAQAHRAWISHLPPPEPDIEASVTHFFELKHFQYHKEYYKFDGTLLIEEALLKLLT